MSGSTSPGTGAKAEPRKKKRRGPLLLFLLLLLAAGGVWASFEYMRSGEVLIPMPEAASKFINDNLVPGGRLGPVRFGEYTATAQPAPELTQNVRPEATALPPATEPQELGWGPGDSATAPPPVMEPPAQAAPDTPGDERAQIPPAPAPADAPAPAPQIAEAQSAPAVAPAPAVTPAPTQTTVAEPQPRPTPPRPSTPRVDTPARPPKPVPGGKVTPPDTGWRDQAATPYEEIRETVEAGPEPGESAPRRQPTRHDVAVFEAPEPEGMGPNSGSSLVLAFDASAEKRPNVLMPVNLSVEPGAAEETAGAGKTRPKIYSGEDSIVSLDFVGDLVNYLAANYWPAGTHPSAKGKAVSMVSLKSLNQRYGIDLHGFSTGAGAVRDYSRDREQVLNYVFMPSMLQALTNLYLDRFADALAAMETVTDSKGNTRRLTKAQRVGMLEHYAADARALSDAIGAYASSPDAAALTNAYIRSEQETQSANARFLDAKQAMEIAAEEGDQAGMQEAGRDVARLEAAYRRSMERQRGAEVALRNLMNKGSSARLGERDLVYAACWLNRRAASAETLRAAANSTMFAARVLGEKASALRGE